MGRLDLIKFYVALGLRYVEILQVLPCKHNTVLSLRSLKHILWDFFAVKLSWSCGCFPVRKNLASGFRIACKPEVNQTGFTCSSFTTHHHIKKYLVYSEGNSFTFFKLLTEYIWYPGKEEN